MRVSLGTAVTVVLQGELSLFVPYFLDINIHICALLKHFSI